MTKQELNDLFHWPAVKLFYGDEMFELVSINFETGIIVGRQGNDIIECGCEGWGIGIPEDEVM